MGPGPLDRYFEGDGDGLCDGEGDGDGVGVGSATELARGLLATGRLGVAIGAGPWLATRSASGTTIIPAMTVKTNVTAPHSRRSTPQSTSRKFYRAPKSGVSGPASSRPRS